MCFKLNLCLDLWPKVPCSASFVAFLPTLLRLILLDWENVGVGSGPQEIAQFLISHMDPGLRATVESEVLQEYYHSLISRNPQIAEVMSYDE